jgi:hypothetical protein
MIVCNGQELNLSVPTTDNENFVLEWTTKFREEKGENGVIVLKDTTPLTKNRKIFKPKRGFDVSGSRVNPKTGIKEKWMYCTQQPRSFGKSDRKIYSKHHANFFNELRLSVKDDMELIFCLLNFVNIGQFGFYIENKEEVAKKKLDQRKAASEVENWINNKCKPEEIIKLAYRWGLDPEDKSDAELRVELFEKISSFEQTKDKKRGYQVFIDEMNSNSNVMKIATYFYKGIQDKKIGKNPSNRTFF